jgi:hypothetical protein
MNTKEPACIQSIEVKNRKSTRFVRELFYAKKHDDLFCKSIDEFLGFKNTRKSTVFDFLNYKCVQ